MEKIFPIISTFLLVLCLGFAVDDSRCITFTQSDSSESSSENQRECSIDEKTGRIARVPNIIRQIKTPFRYFNRIFSLISKQVTKFELNLRGNNLSPVSSCSVFSTSVLRI
jgi:hypothetical protein